jgi:predicted kinase
MRPKIVVLVGLPGSGKTTWLRERSLPALSSDETRRLLCGAVENQSINRLVFSAMRELLRRRLEAGAGVTYLDATSLALWERRAWIRCAELLDCGIEALYFDTPLDVCLERNRLRERVVPEEAMRLMARRLTPPTVEEGFDRITVVRPIPEKL